MINYLHVHVEVGDDLPSIYGMSKSRYFLEYSMVATNITEEAQQSVYVDILRTIFL